MEPKTAASLTGGLLARKGLARPAMRRQPVAGLGPRPIGALDDLGWNDMGEDAPAPVAAAPVPSPVAKHIAAIQETLARREEERKVASAPAPRAKAPVAPRKAPAAPVAATPVIAAPIVTDSRKSAFTLRIDAERHLRLRLLSAVTNQSAQQLLIGALDALIAQNPNIDALAADPNARPGASD